MGVGMNKYCLIKRGNLSKNRGSAQNPGKFYLTKPKKRGINLPMKKIRFYNKTERRWIIIDAKDKTLGRLATRIAEILQGKSKPENKTREDEFLGRQEQ